MFFVGNVCMFLVLMFLIHLNVIFALLARGAVVSRLLWQQVCVQIKADTEDKKNRRI